MLSITPSYVYTFVALLAVGSLLVIAFSAYADALRLSSQLHLLRNLVDRVATKITELQVLLVATNTTSEAFVQMPASIGNRQYWLQLRSDSSKAWLQGGLGNMPINQTDLLTCLPNGILAAGYFVGGFGAAHLVCEMDAGVPKVWLESSNEGE